MELNINSPSYFTKQYDSKKYISIHKNDISKSKNRL